MTDFDVIIIGGGASGMMSAISATTPGPSLAEGEKVPRVLIIEKNKSMGEKLKISGGGRCNIFNDEIDARILLNNYGENAKYLHTPFSKFGLKETKEFFKNIGIETKVEDRKRAFPISEKAIDVYNALEKKLIKNNVEVKLNSSVNEIVFDAGKVAGIKIKNVENIYTAEKYILATGGYSHPETGSTGDGFKFLKNLNLNLEIVEASPSLVPVTVSNEWVKKLTGKTVENLKMSFYVDGVKKKVLKYKNPPAQPHPQPLSTGEGRSAINPSGFKNAVASNRILFTHFGLSGPTILNNSKDISDWLKEGEVTLSLDLFPQYDEKQFDKFLLNIFEENKNAGLQTILKKIYPGNILTEIFLGQGPHPTSPFRGGEVQSADSFLRKQVNDVRVEERRFIRETLKNLKINITGLMGFDKAIIADGGVNVNEVNFENMSLKKIPNLFVTGDMLNISRPSGGFSLQLCWTTGFIAGLH